jgi:hypothetical protein
MSKSLAEMTDDDHIRYMLDGGDRGLIERLWETKDAWTFGGGVWIGKEHPLIKFDARRPSEKPDFLPLSRHCQFEARSFHLHDTGAHGVVIWLQTGPRDEGSPSLKNRTLCGWVPLEREVEARTWVWVLNDLIESHVAKQEADWSSLTDAQRTALINDAHFESGVRFLERVGIPIPEYTGRDEFMAALQKLEAADAPVAARRVASLSAEEKK